MLNLRSYDEFVVNDIENTTKNLIVRNEQIEESIGTSGTIFPEFKRSCAEIDQEIIDTINEINQIKREIVTISERALNARTNRRNFLSIGDNFLCKVSTDPSSYNKYNFISPGTVELTRAFRGATVFSSELNRFISTDSVITRAPVYPDILQAWFFEQLEGNFENIGVDEEFPDPTFPGEYQILLPNRNNLGIGKTSNPFFNSELNGVTNYTNSLGFFYDITNTVGICNIRSEIDPLMARINGLRSKVTQLAKGVSQVKKIKTDKQISLWSLYFSKNFNKKTIENNNVAVKVIKDKYK